MPAPDADIKAVLASQEFFRLKQVVQSPGDIYELEESSRAIYIGPDSDISEVQATYVNPEGALETAVVAVNGPLVGRVDSLPLTIVGATGQPARILLSPVDLVDNNYASPLSQALRRFNVPAYIDVMVALKTLPDIPDVRADRTLRYSSLPYNTVGSEGNDGSTDLIIPIYGRRMVSVTAIGNGITCTMSLVNLLPGVNVRPRTLGSFSIPTIADPAGRGAHSGVFRASDAARHGINYAPDGTITGGYTESDQPGGSELAPDFPVATPQVRGMADLMIINVAQYQPFGGGDAMRFADLYIKIADRET